MQLKEAGLTADNYNVDTSRSGVLAIPASAHKLGKEQIIYIENGGEPREYRKRKGRGGAKNKKGIVEGEPKRMSNSRRHIFMLNMLTLQLQVVSVVGPPQPLSQISQPAIINHNWTPLTREFYPVVSPSSSQLQVVFVLAFSFLSSLTSSINQSPIINHQSSIINTCTHIHI